MSEDFDWTVLDRYFSGESSPSEVAVIERWIAASPVRAAEVEAVRAIWLEAGARLPSSRFDTQAAKARLHAKMAEPMRPVASAGARDLVMLSAPRSRRAWAIAAGIAVVVAGGVLSRVTRLSEPAASVAAVGQEYTTSWGQRRELRLSDGTRVMLGPKSRLTVVRAHGATRDVRLEGHAYFEVVHDERHPFSVFASGAVIRDLGTEFDVRAYTGDRDVQVVVAAGQVALDAQLLLPGQLGERSHDGRVTVRAAGDLDRYLGWTAGRLVFTDTPLVEALPELERWYGLKFHLADNTLARLPLSGALEARPSAETLDLLAALLDARVSRHGDTVVLGRGR